MRFLAETALYTSTDACLRFLRDLAAVPGAAGGAARRHHVYWRGPFGRKQAFALKSLLATQPRETCEVWLWLDGEAGYAGHEENPSLRPLLPFVKIRRLDLDREVKGTPAAGRAALHAARGPAARSDIVRFVALYKHGGVYADMDMMFLRDLGPLFGDPRFADEFCYQWSSQPFANSAVLALRQGSAAGRELLVRGRELGTYHPRRLLRFADTTNVDLLVLPSAFFDPLWLRRDGKDPGVAVPFARFSDFFEPIGPGRTALSSYREFFPGAFAYHWHNGWDAPETPDSFFGRFERELDEVLRRRRESALAGPEHEPREAG